MTVTAPPLSLPPLTDNATPATPKASDGGSTQGGASDAVEKAVPGQDHRVMTPGEYLHDLNKTAIYAMTRGGPLVLIRHVTFMVTYIDAWLRQGPDTTEQAAEALFGRWPRCSQRRIAKWLKSDRIGNRPLLVSLLAPLVLPLVFWVPLQFALSVVKSALDVLRKGVRGVPPLITAVVVVFVTNDAWKILGAGFTPRFGALVGVFLLASLYFLIRHWNCWGDIDADPKEAALLLEDIKRKRVEIREFTGRIQAAPMVRPRGSSAIRVYLIYLTFATFALMVAAGLVSLALIVIGVILINKDQTMTLAKSANVYHTPFLPGGVVVTSQLLSLSFSLGAFAAFFLVAAQHPEDREAFMKNALVRYRQALLVYSVYYHACDQAADWTPVSVDVGHLTTRPGAMMIRSLPTPSPSSDPFGFLVALIWRL